MDRLIIEGEVVRVETPEGQTAEMPLPDFLAKLCAPRSAANGETVCLPDGVKCVFKRGPWTIWCHITAPRVHNLKWLRSDSPAAFGKGATYRDVKIALPYVITMATFAPGGVLTERNECFFRNAPLQDPARDELFYPALLNCSKFRQEEGHPLSWICTQHLKAASLDRNTDLNTRMRTGFTALMHTLLETGFNRSSEEHEGSSWFDESSRAIPQIRTVEAWESATARNPLFALDLPWLPTGRTVSQVAARMFDLLGARDPAIHVATSADLARLVLNRRPRRTAPSSQTPAPGLSEPLKHHFQQLLVELGV
jgi:hypothetical protein